MATIDTLTQYVEHAASAGPSRGLWFHRDAPPGTSSAAHAFVPLSTVAQEARAYAGALAAHDLRPGDRVAFVVPSAQEALPLLLGILHAGLVALPIAAPATAAERDACPAQLTALLHDASASMLVMPEALRALRGPTPDAREETAMLSLEALRARGTSPRGVLCDARQPALLMARLGAPRFGARVISRGSLAEGIARAARALALRGDDVLVSWLPATSDAGLLALLLSVAHGRAGAFLSPVQFLKRPARWLRLISDVGGTLGFAPEHAYAYAARRVADDELTGIDLSSWRVAGVSEGGLGAHTRAQFGARFAPVRFDARAFASASASASTLRLVEDGVEHMPSEGQKALWFLAQLAPDSIAYNVPLCFRVRSPLSADALRETLARIVGRHAALRTVFPALRGRPRRHVLREAPPAFEEIDARGLDDGALRARIADALARPFDVQEGPLLVTRLYRRSETDAVLLLSAHHLNVDALSFLVIGAELSLLYGPIAAGIDTAALPAPAASYDAFVAQQAELLAGGEGRRQARYWASQLAGAPAALDLPTDRPRPLRPRHHGARVPVQVPEELAHALREVAAQHGATLFTVMLAVFHALLHRRSGQADLVVATPVAGRAGDAFDDVVGFFVNTLPLRARIDPSTSFGALVVQLRECVAGALDHADLPFARIVEQTNLPRDPSRAPLCQVMFQLQTHRPREGVGEVMRASASGAAAQLGGLVIEPFEIARGVAQFELQLDLTDFGAGVTGFCEYDTALFDEGTITQLVADYLALARALSAAPAETVAPTRPPLPEAMRTRVLEDWNATDVRYEDGRVHRAIAAQAARTPQAIALTFGDAQRSYAELDARAHVLARGLRALGAGRDVLVGVAMERSLELVTVLLAVLKAGAAYVPLDPSLPPERLRFMRDDAEATLVIVDPVHGALLEGGAARVLSAEALMRLAEAHAEDDVALPDDVRPEDLAYVIYTSGSTGAPKGVGNTHAGLWNRLRWMQDALPLQARDVVLQKTPYSFDVSVWELFWPLMVGARLAIARPEGHKDTRYLLAEIARRGVTTLHFVPSMLAALLHEPDLAEARTLRQVVCSGEALSHALMNRFFARLRGVALHNLYGPTEAAIDVTAWACAPEPAEAESGASVPIGRPIANTRIYLLDDAREPVPVGAIGELYIGGVQVARGYHRRPALTAERFVRDPFCAGPGARMYKTGDLARYRDDGLIEYLGRNDDQVKLRGFRVELGEIEGVLATHPDVRACVVAARSGEAGGARLEAFVVAAPEGRIEPSALGRWLAARLPEYMVPAAIVPVDAIPLTHSGKADRRALLARAQEEVTTARVVVAPRSDAERALADALRAVLGVDDPSIHDNYFALGGDSIRSLEVRARVKRAGFDFEVGDLLTHQTIAALAPRLRASASADVHALAPFALVRPAERASLAAFEDAYPATQLQLGMLYHSELTAASSAYHDVMSFTLALSVPFHEAAMREALALVMARHPVLRAAFDVASYARPLMVVRHEVAPPLEVRDLQGLDAAAAARAMAEHVIADKTRGYALDEAPLFRLVIHVLAPARVQLTLGFHHAILDGWSTATFLRELLSAYLPRAGTPGANALPEFAAPRHRFSALVAEEQRALASEASRAFWTARLADCEVVRLARWPERHRRAQPGSERLTHALDAALTQRLEQLAQTLGAPLKVLLLAAHVATLAAFTGTDDVLTGRVVHGRPEVDEAERILGLFLNTVPVRVAVAELSWAALVAELVRDEQAVHPHRHFPLREIHRLAGRPTLFETAFNFVHFHLYDGLVASGLVDVQGYEAHENTTFGLMVNAVLSPQTGSLSLQLEYDAAEIADAQAAQLVQAHVLALEALARDPEARVVTTSLVDASEHARLVAFQGASAPRSNAPVHALFADQVARTPQAVAITCDGASLDYASLEARANGVAADLRASGVAAGSVVGVCAEPSLARAVAVLGVLKAGCAYLPLDPEYPPERLAYMLQDAGARLVLATPAHATDAFLAGVVVRTIGARCEPAPPAVTVRGGDAAYVIYTSGSTGKPKGIVMPHAPLANLVTWQTAESAHGEGVRTAHVSAFSFDVAFQELFSTWAAGGTLVVVPEASRRDTRALAKLLIDAQVARLFVPVVMLHQLAEITEQLGLDLPALREVCTAGEQLEITEPVRRFFARHPGCSLSNHYGPSETHVATAHALGDDVAGWPRLPSIGRPLPGVRAYVLDARARPVPIGVVGELHLGGACVARGYTGHPGLTAERFVRDPFAARADARMYRTGDLVQWQPDGTLAYLGRRDGQLKVRGYRVELAEVEAVIMARCGDRLRRAAVVALPSRARASRWELAAYLVPHEGVRLDLADVRAVLARALPAPMQPSSLTVLDALPLTPSGKLDRRALPAPATSELRSAVRVLPETPLEVALSGLFREVLGVPELGVTDDFFARGGDSLGAVRLMARVERRYGVSLPIATLLAEPTVRALAHVLAREATQREPSCLVPLTPTDERGRPPVFCVHPVGGNVLCYVALARRLGTDQPFYGLSARGLDGRAPPHTSVVEMAAAYASEIVAAQPYGKVHLAGWSFGGIVAVEVARQLHAAGRDVAPVVVMDTIASVRFQVQPSEDDLFECVAMELFGAGLDEGGFDEILDRGAALSQAERFARLTASARARGILPEGADATSLEHVFAVIQSNIRAAYDHVPLRFAGEIVLLRCLDAMPARLKRLHDMVGSAHDDAQNGWSALCQKLEVLPVHGDHLTIVFEPHVGQVAATLRRIVDASLEQVAAE
ncbi:MAG: amino acid adenylation domain-containing protein [Polyangiales bacterium]